MGGPVQRLAPGNGYLRAKDDKGTGFTGVGNVDFKSNPWGAAVNVATKTNPLGWTQVAGYNLGDPFDLAGNKKKAKPPPVKAPPPPADTTGAQLREASRAETDRDIRQTKRRSMMGGTY